MHRWLLRCASVCVHAVHPLSPAGLGTHMHTMGQPVALGALPRMLLVSLMDPGPSHHLGELVISDLTISGSCGLGSTGCLAAHLVHTACLLCSPWRGMVRGALCAVCGPPGHMRMCVHPVHLLTLVFGGLGMSSSWDVSSSRGSRLRWHLG